MSETMVMRLEVERGMYASFPENFKPYMEARAVVATGDLAVEIGEQERPVFYTQNGVAVRGAGIGVTDEYIIEPLGKGMFVDNIAGTDGVEGAVTTVLAGNGSGTLQHIESATFVGEDTIAAAMSALEQLESPDAALLHQMAALAVNYAKRDVGDVVTQP